MNQFFSKFRFAFLSLALLIGLFAGQSASAAPVIGKSDWIYYTKDGSGIYKNKIDAKRKESRMTTDSVLGDIIVDNTYVYYINTTGLKQTDDVEGGYLYRMKLDGSSKTKMTTDVISSFGISKGYVYYSYLGTASSDGTIKPNPGKVYRIKSGSSSKKEILDVTTNHIAVDGNYIYYVNEDEGSVLYRAKTDGKKDEKLSDDAISDTGSFKVYDGDYIVYRTSEDSAQTMMTTEGDDAQELSADAQVLGFKKDDVYFIEDDTLYKQAADDDDSDAKKVAEAPTATVLAYDVSKQEYIIQKSDGTLTRIDFDDDYGDVKLKKLEIDRDEIEIRDGSSDSVALYAIYSDDSKVNVTTEATWTSSKESVAYYVNGKIKAVKKGTATIKASYGGKTKSIKVKVTKK